MNLSRSGSSRRRRSALAVFDASPRLYLEDRSTTTLENAEYTAQILGVHSAELHVIVVTDAAHTFRCRRMFGRHFRVVHAAGTSAEGWSRWRSALREAAAVLRHGLSGRL